MTFRFVLNGRDVEVDCWEGESLLYLLRERLGMWGAKNACEQGECGSCSVLLDGQLVCSCLVLAPCAAGGEVVTVEGLADRPAGRAVQAAMVEAGAIQCGFCTPGFVVAMTSLLEQSLSEADGDPREALSGNLCRCTGYTRILESVERARTRLAGSREMA